MHNLAGRGDRFGRARICTWDVKNGAPFSGREANASFCTVARVEWLPDPTD
jgi:hypothetical protein